MKLKDWLKEARKTLDEFSEESGVDKGTIRNILKGFDIRVSTAFKIIDFTRNAVKIEDLRPTVTRPSKPKKPEIHREVLAISYNQQQEDGQYDKEVTNAQDKPKDSVMLDSL
jgi:transcriptional regulator with XRE-family HTH domain